MKKRAAFVMGDLYPKFASLMVFALLMGLFCASCGQSEHQSIDKNDGFDKIRTVKGDETFPEDSYITVSEGGDHFSIAGNGEIPTIMISSSDFPGVERAASDLQTDIGRVTGNAVPISVDALPDEGTIILVGTYGQSDLINMLVENGKIDLSELENKWEQYIIETVENPIEGIEKALVIAGSDKRGTIYGIYDLAENIGVSPWYWWADVPVKTYAELYVKPGRYTEGEPKVKYRGIFLNDEAPALSGWVTEKFGGFNHQFYEKVYELILRLKGNYLWPAMWGRSLFDDDSLSAPLANEYGVVLGTSHHEPMMRSHIEWDRYGKGPWNYEENEEVLRTFWLQGIERMGDNESIVTLAMRGDGDMAMSEESNISLLQKIVKDQREILEDVTGKQAEEIPQLWALYKEVQDYYNKGMRVPEDITLLLCDDNWGNQRILPKPGSEPREGGYGVYYHYDFVGGPRNYKWLNTNPISRVWEQMNLAYRHGVDRIWLVNVGDLKPMELPISFFLNFAWNPDAIQPEDLPAYHIDWARQQFGDEFAEEIAEILMKYTKYNSRRKPEMLSPDTYSLVNYREAESIVEDYNALAKNAEELYAKISEEYKDAYYQLVLFPVLACANLNDLHVSTGLNHLYAEQGRVIANALADKVEKLFEKDKALSAYYHETLADGKWNHMMSQTHISYTYWQQPEKDVVPELKKVNPTGSGQMGVGIEGSKSWWPHEESDAVLPGFDVFNKQSRFTEIFNRGTEAFEFKIQSNKPWVKVSNSEGQVQNQERVWIEIDWENIPTGKQSAVVQVTDENGENVEVLVHAIKPESPGLEAFNGYIEANGYVSIDATKYSKKVDGDNIVWKTIPDLGRTGSSVTTFPVTHSRVKLQDNSPHMEYQVHLLNAGKVKVKVYVAPTLNIYSTEGLKYGISFNDKSPQIVNIHEGDTVPDWNYPAWWNNAVSQNIKILESEHVIEKPGAHVLKYWAVDPAIVVQKIVIITEDVKPSYLGPPESYFQSVD